MTKRSITLTAESKEIFDMLAADRDNHPAIAQAVGEIVLSALMTGELTFRDRVRLELFGNIEAKEVQ